MDSQLIIIIIRFLQLSTWELFLMASESTDQWDSEVRYFYSRVFSHLSSNLSLLPAPDLISSPDTVFMRKYFTDVFCCTLISEVTAWFHYEAPNNNSYMTGWYCTKGMSEMWDLNAMERGISVICDRFDKAICHILVNQFVTGLWVIHLDKIWYGFWDDVDLVFIFTDLHRVVIPATSYRHPNYTEY